MGRMRKAQERIRNVVDEKQCQNLIQASEEKKGAGIEFISLSDLGKIYARQRQVYIHLKVNHERRKIAKTTPCNQNCP